MKQDSPSSCPSLFLRRCLSRRWLITDSVPVSLSRPSRLLAAFGLLENKQEERVESSLFFFLIKAVVVRSMLVQKPENYYADQLQSCCSTASSLRLLCSPQNYLRVKRQFNINDLKHSTICTSSIIMPLKKLPQDCCMKLPQEKKPTGGLRKGIILACSKTTTNYKTALAANTLAKEMRFQHSSITIALIPQICSIPA